MLAVIAGYDELDPTTINTPVSDYRRSLNMQTSNLRLSLLQHPFFDSLDPEIARAIDAAIVVLRKLTASVKDVELPPTAIPLDQIYVDVRSVEVYAYHSQWLAEVSAKYGATTRQRLVENAADVQPSAYAQSRRQLELLRRQIKTTFAEVDLLVTPTTSLLPAKIADNVDSKGRLKYPLGIRNTAPFDVLGVPAISVPCGFTTSGLPVGLQIAGAPFAESTVVALAHAYERETEWHRRNPLV